MSPAAEQRKVVIVTGASSGIGLACAARLHREGHAVYGAARSMPSQELGRACPGLVQLKVDVTREDSVRGMVEEVARAEGRIDALVNNAGYGLSGAVEETEIEEARAQLDTNFLGYVRMVRAVLPGMRERGGGTLVNISSLAGLIGIPFQSMYSASKFAIEGWSEALRLELAPFGIRVVLVEPGDVKTGFTSNRVRARRAGEDGPYREAFQRALGVMETDEQRGPGPDVVARAVSAILRSRSPRLRYRVGDAFQCASVGLRHWLPARLVEWGLGKYYKLA